MAAKASWAIAPANTHTRAIINFFMLRSLIGRPATALLRPAIVAFFRICSRRKGAAAAGDLVDERSDREVPPARRRRTGWSAMTSTLRSIIAVLRHNDPSRGNGRLVKDTLMEPQ
jgi:hypothetical protein